MDADTQEAAKVVGKLKDYIGEVTQNNLIGSLAAIQDLFSVFSANGIIGSTELRVKYERPPIETAKTVMGHIKLIKDAASVQAVKQKDLLPKARACLKRPENPLVELLRI